MFWVQEEKVVWRGRIIRHVTDFSGNNLVIGCGHGDLSNGLDCKLRVLSGYPDDKYKKALQEKTVLIYAKEDCAPLCYNYTVVCPSRSGPIVTAQGEIKNENAIKGINSAIQDKHPDNKGDYLSGYENALLQTFIYTCLFLVEDKYVLDCCYETYKSSSREYHANHCKEYFYAIDINENTEPDLLTVFTELIPKDVIPDEKFTFILLENKGIRNNDNLFANIKRMLHRNGVCAVASITQNLSERFITAGFQVIIYNGLILASKTQNPLTLLSSLDKYARDIIANPNMLYDISSTRPFIGSAKYTPVVSHSCAIL